MNTISNILLTLLLTCCTLTIHAKEASESQPTAKFERYSNVEKGYSLEYPADWKKNDVPQLDLVLFAPPKKPGERIHASMNIVSERVGTEIRLDQFYNESLNNLSTALKDVTIEKNGTSDLGGVPTKWMLYTHTMQGVKFRVLQYFIVANGAMYLITFSTAADEFDAYRPEFDKIIQSFKLQATK